MLLKSDIERLSQIDKDNIKKVGLEAYSDRQIKVYYRISKVYYKRYEKSNTLADLNRYDKALKKCDFWLSLNLTCFD